jgi:hypothetical protein
MQYYSCQRHKERKRKESYTISQVMTLAKKVNDIKCISLISILLISTC